MGSVYPVQRKRQDGTIREGWAASIVYRDEQTRKAHRLYGYGATQEAAIAALDRLKAKPAVRRRLAPKRGTLSEFATAWIAGLERQPATKSSYDLTCRKYVLSHAIARRPIANLSAADLRSYFNGLKESGTSDRTRRKVYDILSPLLKSAVKSRVLAENPLEGVERPLYRPEPAAKRALSNKQIAKLITAAAGDPLEALYVVALYSGAREGELLALRWRDVSGSSIEIGRTLQDVDGKPEAVDRTKTDAPPRTVLLPKIAADALKAHKAKSRFKKPDDLVFANERGNPMQRQNLLRRSFQPLLKKAKLPATLHFHDLRHTNATMLLRGGIHPKLAQVRLGHSRIQTTLDTYTHASDDLQKPVAQFLQGTYAVRRPKKGAPSGKRKPGKP
jgi:integrase